MRLNVVCTGMIPYIACAAFEFWSAYGGLPGYHPAVVVSRLLHGMVGIFFFHHLLAFSIGVCFIGLMGTKGKQAKAMAARGMTSQF
jgi:hypothetical protein